MSNLPTLTRSKSGKRQASSDEFAAQAFGVLVALRRMTEADYKRQGKNKLTVMEEYIDQAYDHWLILVEQEQTGA